MSLLRIFYNAKLTFKTLKLPLIRLTVGIGFFQIDATRPGKVVDISTRGKIFEQKNYFYVIYSIN